MDKTNIALGILNVLSVPLNLGFYFYGEGRVLNLIAAIACIGAATLCFVVARRKFR